MNGPDPETADAVPGEHRPVDGAEYVPTPFADPHTAFTRSGAEHDALVPPFAPLQFQLHGPDPLTVVAVPDEQRFDDGADVTPTPFADPHTPFCMSGAEHDAFVPPFAPLHVHAHGPVPLTADAVPDEQRLELDVDIVPVLSALPHVPLMAQSGLAFEQFAVVPPPDPTQFHVRVVLHAVAPLSPDTDPNEQAPAAELQAPLTGGLLHAASDTQKLAIDPVQEIRRPLHAAPLHVLEPEMTSLLSDGQVKSSTSQLVFLHG